MDDARSFKGTSQASVETSGPGTNGTSSMWWDFTTNRARVFFTTETETKKTHKRHAKWHKFWQENWIQTSFPMYVHKCVCMYTKTNHSDFGMGHLGLRESHPMVSIWLAPYWVPGAKTWAKVLSVLYDSGDKMNQGWNKHIQRYFVDCL